MLILIMGPPGVGKGTQAQQLCANLGLTHMSTGDILRDQVKRQTELGMAAKEKMDAGALVPDDLIIKMMLERINGVSGALLDGFPRTIEQAEALSVTGLKIDAVIELDASDDIIIERLSGRLSHPASGRTYHATFSPPKTAGMDDVTGEPLVTRDDDKPETVRARLSVYREQTAPLRDYYRARSEQGGAYIAVDGTQDIAQITDMLTASLRDMQ